MAQAGFQSSFVWMENLFFFHYTIPFPKNVKPWRQVTLPFCTLKFLIYMYENWIASMVLSSFSCQWNYIKDFWIWLSFLKIYSNQNIPFFWSQFYCKKHVVRQWIRFKFDRNTIGKEWTIILSGLNIPNLGWYNQINCKPR